MQTPRTIFLMEQTYATLFALANKVQGKGDQYLQSLTSRQLMAMLAIAHLPEGEASLNHIARMIGATKQSVKQLIRLLEGKGYVKSMPNPRDRRASNIEITPAGQAALIEDGQRGIEFFQALYQDFSEAELETLWSLLKKLYRFDGEEQAGFEEEVDIKP